MMSVDPKSGNFRMLLRNLRLEAERRKRATVDARELATKIADKLMTNGFGDKAQRLVFELPGGRDGGGWCHSALVDQIVDILLWEDKAARNTVEAPE